MPSLLTLNAGSSSIRFALFRDGDPLVRDAHGSIERIGLDGTRLCVRDAPGVAELVAELPARDHGAAVDALLAWLDERVGLTTLTAVGHRVVHGMRHSEPEWIDTALLAELNRISRYDPEHLPREIALIEAIRARHPHLPQLACFDTAFHRDMPRVAKLLPIPRRFGREGVERYGFHGLSCAFLMEELARFDPDAVRGRLILAHLGNGASLTAVHDGRSVDTSMGFTPASGLVMGTRTGDVDPGLLHYLATEEGMSPERIQHLVNHESGLLGVSGSSSDMRDLLAREAGDVAAAEAVALFCQQVKKGIGALAAVLGGLDTLVFAGGIGENAPAVRARICDGLGFIGITLDAMRNRVNAGLVSATESRVTLRVIRTDEEIMIARTLARRLAAATQERH